MLIYNQNYYKIFNTKIFYIIVKTIKHKIINMEPALVNK